MSKLVSVGRRWFHAPLLVLLACGAPAQDSGIVSDTAAPAVAGHRPAPVDSGSPTGVELVRRELALGPRSVVVTFRDVPLKSAPSHLDRAARRQWRAGRLARIGDAALAPLAGLRVERRWEHVQGALVTLDDARALDALLRRPEVVDVAPDAPHRRDLSESLALMGQPAVVATGMTGAGTAVAVLDSGTDYTVSDLGSCSTPGVPTGCRVAHVADFAPDDGLLDDDGHGTNVAAIVARVAPGTRILGLDVFRGASAYTSDIVSAIDWVIATQDTYGTVAMNLSLGGTTGHTAPCSSGGYGGAFAAARAAGIVPVVASGNSAFVNALASPACIDENVSVGAVYDSDVGGMYFSVCSDPTTSADQVACFSNLASFLDLLAPGASIDAGGYTMSGTSQAAPHVAGAVALLAASDATLDVDAIEARLEGTGTLVTDAYTGMTFPRVDIAAAVTGCAVTLDTTAIAAAGDGASGVVTVTAPTACGWNVRSDAAWLTATPSSGTGDGTVTWTVAPNGPTARTAQLAIGGRPVSVVQDAGSGPTGSVVIAGGASGTRTGSVTLTLAASDPLAAVTEMCISNTATCTAWRPFASSLAWSLTSGAGEKTVYAAFRSAEGATSETYTDTIHVDATRPLDGAVVATRGDGVVDLSWSGFTDAASGVASYVVQQAATTAPASCTTGTRIAATADTSLRVAGLTNGSTYGFRVCAVDGAGNLSTGVTTTAIPAPETDAPVGTVTINAGATGTNARGVTLTLSATDASGVTHMCVSSTPACTTWVAYATTRSHTLSTVQGTQTVYVAFRDAYGTVSTPVSDSIVYDTTRPVDGCCTGTGVGSRIACVAWSAATDGASGSGVASYVAVRAAGTTAPATCASTTAFWSGTGTGLCSWDHVDGTTYTYRICAVDHAGNVSTGLTTPVITRPETTPPTGSVTVASGAAWTRTQSVPLTLSASDASGVTEMCISEASTCSTFVPYATTRTFSLAPSQGAHTVNVWYRDTYGNVSATPEADSIQLDSVAPVAGALAASASSGAVSLSWTGFSDATSGLDRYKLVGSTTTTVPNCSSTALYEGSATSFSHTGLVNGVTWSYALCAYDVAGNVSATVRTTARPAPEYNPPTGTLVINGGSAWTGSRTATFTLAATDDTAVTHACVTTGASCSTWSTYATTLTGTLPTGSGTKTMHAYFKDTWGNVSAAATDTIGLDMTAPTNGTATATAGSGSVTLTWSGFADAHAGVTSYRVAGGTTTPTNCTTTASLLWSGTGTTWTDTGRAAGIARTYRVCAVDSVGNVSTGVTKSATPL